MANEVTQRDLQALDTKFTKLILNVNKRFNDVPDRQAVTKILQEHGKEFRTNNAELTRHINQLHSNIEELKADVRALKTAVNQIQTR